MSLINLPSNSAIINNLTVLGNLTAAGYTPAGNLAVAGNLSATGTTTSTGLLTATANASVGGNLAVTGNTTFTGLLTATANATIGGNLTIAGSLLAISLASNTPQAIGLATEAPINFGNVITNTLTTCTLANSNSQFTYIGTPTTLWLITANCRTDNAAVGSNNALAIWVRKNGAGPYYGEVYTTTYGNAVCGLSCATMVPMSTNDYIEVRVYPTANLSIGSNNTYSVSAVTIAQI